MQLAMRILNNETAINDLPVNDLARIQAINIMRKLHDREQIINLLAAFINENDEQDHCITFNQYVLDKPDRASIKR